MIKKIISQPPSKDYEEKFDGVFRGGGRPNPPVGTIKHRTCKHADPELRVGKLYCEFLTCFINPTVCVECDDYGTTN